MNGNKKVKDNWEDSSDEETDQEEKLVNVETKPTIDADENKYNDEAEEYDDDDEADDDEADDDYDDEEYDDYDDECEKMDKKMGSHIMFR
jgi:hypothetical protein